MPPPPDVPHVDESATVVPIELLHPSFLVVLDRAAATRARSLDVVYGVTVQDATGPTGIYVDPAAPCPPLP